MPDQRKITNLTAPTALADAGLIPSGRLREPWRGSLRPPQPGILHSATVAVLVILPAQARVKHASITALLTFPMVEFIEVEALHMTWIFHQ